MQEQIIRIPNRERTEATRGALMAAGRRLFVEKGYAETGTPEIVAAANVTRGALYHHFKDKADLFFAVARAAAIEVANEIDRKTRGQKMPLDALIRGGEAYFAAMAEQGRMRLLLLDAPSVLTSAQLAELSELAGSNELRAGLENLLRSSSKKNVPLVELTDLLSGVFDRAALAIAEGADAKPYKAAVRFLLEKLASEG